jgi:hypothetical protein
VVTYFCISVFYSEKSLRATRTSRPFWDLNRGFSWKLVGPIINPKDLAGDLQSFFVFFLFLVLVFIFGFSIEYCVSTQTQDALLLKHHTHSKIILFSETFFFTMLGIITRTREVFAHDNLLRP